MVKFLLAAGAGAAALAVAASGAGAPAAVPATTAIVGATVFDGTGAPPRVATVLIRGDRIVAVGAGLAVPAGARVIDARGRALTPGLYDLHTHWTAAGEPTTFPPIATAYVQAGVTTVDDFNEAPEAFAPLRSWLATLVAPHVNFAARISTPGGHGADWADQNTTKWVNTPEAARAAIDSLAPYRPDLIKAFTDGWRYGAAPDNTSMDGWTLSALTDAAHEHGLKVVTHTVTVDRGVLAARSGVDLLAHGMQDRLLTPTEVAAIKATGMADIPTLAVYDPNKDPAHQMDPRKPAEAQRLAKFNYALRNVKLLFDAGVPIAVGTDAGMPATPHGSSTLHELELLVRAGLTPAQALVAATRVSAHLLAQDGDRGTIAPGKRADLVLFDGRPWQEIGDVHRLVMTMIDGRPVWGIGAPPLPAANTATQLPPASMPALIDNFERSDGRSVLDTLRVDNPDGGLDRSVEVSQIVGREDGGHALELAGRMAMKPNAYVGVALPLSRGSIRPGDLTPYRGVRIDVRGNGCSVRLALNGVAGASWSAPVAVTGEWRKVEIPFATLRPAGRRTRPWSGTDVTEVELGGGCPGGQKLWLQTDNWGFYR